MRPDHHLQRDVLEGLDYDPAINCSHIGVAVRDGIVTLSGHVPSLGEKQAAAIAVWSAPGVTSVHNKVAVV